MSQVRHRNLSKIVEAAAAWSAKKVSVRQDKAHAI